MADASLSKHRVFTPSFKHAAIVRLEAGEALAAVARDAGISRKVFMAGARHGGRKGLLV